MLNVLLWAPLAGALLALVLPRALARWAGVLGVAGGARRSRSRWCSTSAAARPGSQHVVDESWIPDLGVRYQLGVDGISLFLVLLTTVLWFASTLWSALRGEPSDGRDRLYYFLVGLGRDRRPGRVPRPRTCCCSSSSST